MKYAVISTDNNSDYLFPIPLTCISWSKIGYIPVVIHVDVSDEEYNILKRYCPPTTVFLGQVNEMPNEVKSSTLAQVARLTAHRLFNDEDIIITGDADMLVCKDIFTHEGVVCYGHDLTGFSETPICYFKAPVSKWKEIIGNTVIQDLPNAKSQDWNLYWGVDQQLLTSKAKEYGLDNITFVNRGFSGPIAANRWDRYCWDKVPDDIIDVHMLRSPMHEERWPLIKDMCKRLWPADNWEWLEEYKKEFENVMSQYGNYKSHGLELYHISETDEFDFLKDVGNWSNHRCLLLLALHLIDGIVVEYGSGEGSTPYLKKWCDKHDTPFFSYDNNKDWCEKTGSTFVADWSKADVWNQISVAFIDHAPGEHRHIAVKKLLDKADIIVCHDTELNGAGNYMWEKVFPLFRFQLHYNRTGGGAGASMLSNTIDVSKYAGMKLGEFQFDV